MGTLNQKNKNKQDDETEIDLGKLFKALMRRLPIILLVTLCFSAIGFSYGKYYLHAGAHKAACTGYKDLLHFVLPQ